MSNKQHVRELALITARAKIVELIAARAPERFDRYADLRSQARTRAAWDLISHGQPLDGRSDPYERVERVGIARPIAKLWCMETLGNGAPKTKWSSDAVKEYRENGLELPKAATVAKAMLEAFPALKTLEEHPRKDLWATLQYLESEAILGTMLILKRRHKVPSYSMHDGLLVPQLKWDLATDILKTEYHRVIGVEPMITVDPEPETFDARYL